MAFTIVVDNQKGGVGKTTLSFNLAKGLASQGQKVLVVDNDPQGNLTSALLEDPLSLSANVIDLYEQDEVIVQPQEVGKNLYLVGADIHLAKIAERDFEVIFKLREGLAVLKDGFDSVIIDCLPSFGLLNMAALNAADYVLIPTRPSPFALKGMKDLFDTITKVQKRFNPALEILGIVLNQVEGRKTMIAQDLEDVLRESYGELVFSSKISKAVNVEESPAFNQSIMEYKPNSKVSTEFNHFINEVTERITMTRAAA